MASRKPSPRAERRAAERAAIRTVRARERLVTLLPGGAPHLPLEVPSASVIETHARGTRCAHCDGALRIEEHVALAHEGRRLRVVHAACPRCGARRLLYYRIAEAS